MKYTLHSLSLLFETDLLHTLRTGERSCWEQQEQTLDKQHDLSRNHL